MCFFLSQGVLQDLWNISESSSSNVVSGFFSFRFCKQKQYLLLLHWFGARETCYSKSRQHGSHRNTLSCHNHGEFFFPLFSSLFSSTMFLLVIAAAYLEAQSIWEPFKRRLSVESNTSLETGRPFNLREIVQFQNDSKWVWHGDCQ